MKTFERYDPQRFANRLSVSNSNPPPNSYLPIQKVTKISKDLHREQQRVSKFDVEAKMKTEPSPCHYFKE